MKKIVKPRYEDTVADMYKPKYYPHKKEICKSMKKKYHSNIKDGKKNLYPGRTQ